jgi:hypothetical protein
MPITLQDNATKTAIANALIGVIEAAATARILIRDSGNATLVTLPMNATGANRFGTVTNGVASSEDIPSQTASAGGTAANFVLEAPNGTPILTGTVTATGGGGDLTINNTTITTGDLVDPAVLTLRAPNS